MVLNPTSLQKIASSKSLFHHAVGLCVCFLHFSFLNFLISQNKCMQKSMKAEMKLLNRFFFFDCGILFLVSNFLH